MKGTGIVLNSGSRIILHLCPATHPQRLVSAEHAVAGLSTV